MTPTTPAQQRYTRFSCPNPQCTCFNRPSAGNIVPRSWTGTHQHIERLRCTACDRECSEREGTLMAPSKLPEATVERLLKCQRWGVCEEGTADICDVEIKTVHRFQRVAAHRAETPHRQSGQHVAVEGGQLDEAHAKRRPKQVEWVHTALAMGRGFLLWVDFGPRTQDTAATLLAQVLARAQQLPLLLTDGWKVYTAACFRSWASCIVPGVVGTWGVSRSLASWRQKRCFTRRWSRSATKAGQVVEVSRRVGYGGPRRFGKQ